jgi:O-antigen/teichoic acid export membrane protein
MSNIYKHGFVYLIGSVTAMFLSYLLYVSLSKLLPPADFGIFGTLIALMFIFLVPQNAIQNAISKMVSEQIVLNKKRGIDKLKKQQMFTFLLVGLFASCLAILASPLISNFLKMDAVLIIITFLCVIPVVLTSVIRGFMQGLQDFNKLSINVTFEALAKLSVTIGIFLIGFGVFGIVIGMFFGFILTFILSLFQMKTSFEFKFSNFDKTILQKIVPLLFIFICLSAFVSIDVLAVKHYFDPTQTAFYSIASLLGKVLFVISLTLSFSMFPKISELHLAQKIHSNELRDTLNFFALISAAVAIALIVFPSGIVAILFGPMYSEASVILPIFGLNSIMLGFAIIATFYLIAQDKKQPMFILPLIIAIEAVGLFVWHNTLIEVAKVLLSSSFIYLTLSLFFVFNKRIKNIIRTVVATLKKI